MTLKKESVFSGCRDTQPPRAQFATDLSMILAPEPPCRCSSSDAFQNRTRVPQLKRQFYWNQQQAYGDLKDLGDKLLGVDVTPHLIRALIGKIILDSYPGGHAIAQQVLGHKQLATTVNYYAPTKPSDARALYHELLERPSQRKDFEVL